MELTVIDDNFVSYSMNVGELRVKQEEQQEEDVLALISEKEIKEISELTYEDICGELFPEPEMILPELTELSSLEIYYLDFFLETGAVICSVGVPAITEMWQTSGFQVALESELVRTAICAFSASILEKNPAAVSDYPVESVPKRVYFDNCLSSLRDKISNGKPTNPLELVLASYLIAACAIAEFDLLPVVSKTGDADLLGISEGNSALFQLYRHEIENSFANVLFLQQYHENLCQEKYQDKLIEIKFEFIEYLEYKLNQTETDKEDIRVYSEVLTRLWMSCSFAMTINNMYPLMGFFYSLSNEFRQRVRQRKPFAMVIFAFICAFFRRTILRTRPDNDTWDQCLHEIINEIPTEYKSMVEDAQQMRSTNKFNFDIDRFYNAPIY